MEIDAKFFAELWEAVKDFVPNNKREELARNMLEVFVDNDVEIEDIEDLRDIDDDLDQALDDVFADADEEEYEEDYD